MAVIWDKSLATGSFHVDQQHQELFRQVAALSDAIKQGKRRDEIRRALDFLEQYIVQHFAEEEKLMEELHCPPPPLLTRWIMGDLSSCIVVSEDSSTGPVPHRPWCCKSTICSPSG